MHNSVLGYYPNCAFDVFLYMGYTIYILITIYIYIHIYIFIFIRIYKKGDKLISESSYIINTFICIYIYIYIYTYTNVRVNQVKYMMHQGVIGI